MIEMSKLFAQYCAEVTKSSALVYSNLPKCLLSINMNSAEKA